MQGNKLQTGISMDEGWYFASIIKKGENKVEVSAFVYIILTILTVLLGLFVQNESFTAKAIRGGRTRGELCCTTRQQAGNRVAVFAIYCLLTGVSACRIAVGNDYWVYRMNFDLIAQDRRVSSEIGFNSIVRFFQWLFDPGKVQYVSIFAFFSILTVYFFVRALWDQGSQFAFSLFLLMTGGYYFNSLNSVRYYFALALALFSMKYVLRGEYGKFILWVFCGALIHKSVLLVIPVYIFARFLASAKWKRWHYVVGAALVSSLIFGQEIYREIIFFFYPFYRDSVFDNGRISWINILKCVCVLALCVLCYKESLKEDIAGRFYAILNLFGLVVYSCGSFIPETSRIGYYFIIAQVFLIPRLIAGMRIKWLKHVTTVGVVVAFTGYFIMLLRGMYATDIRLLPYLNWIFN